MDKEKFFKIMKECGHTAEVAEWAWDRRPASVDDLDEEKIRDFAMALKYILEFNLF